jgi:hypothetical protein
MFGKGAEGNAVIVARETHEGMYRKGINMQAPTGLYHQVYDFIADVTPDDGGEVFRATFTELFESDTEHRPVPGESARVKIDKNNVVKFDRKALWEQAKTEKAAGHDKFTALANAAPDTGGPVKAPAPTGDPKVDIILYGIYRAQRNGDALEVARLETQLAGVRAGLPPAPVTAPAAASSGADQLDQVAKAAELHRTGVLSDAEFAALKAKLLG